MCTKLHRMGVWMPLELRIILEEEVCGQRSLSTPSPLPGGTRAQVWAVTVLPGVKDPLAGSSGHAAGVQRTGSARCCQHLRELRSRPVIGEASARPTRLSLGISPIHARSRGPKGLSNVFGVAW